MKNLENLELSAFRQSWSPHQASVQMTSGLPSGSAGIRCGKLETDAYLRSQEELAWERVSVLEANRSLDICEIPESLGCNLIGMPIPLLPTTGARPSDDDRGDQEDRLQR